MEEFLLKNKCLFFHDITLHFRCQSLKQFHPRSQSIQLVSNQSFTFVWRRDPFQSFQRLCSPDQNSFRTFFFQWNKNISMRNNSIKREKRRTPSTPNEKHRPINWKGTPRFSGWKSPWKVERSSIDSLNRFSLSLIRTKNFFLFKFFDQTPLSHSWTTISTNPMKHLNNFSEQNIRQ